MTPILVLVLTTILASSSHVQAETDSDPMMRKSIIYDKKTPDVFYCPLAKHMGLDEMVVKARALSKLCEFDGKGVPSGHKSDCYNDVDETEYACKEKKRILKRLNDMDPPAYKY